LGHEGDPVEIQPPQARDDGDPKEGRPEHPGVEREPRRAHTDGHDRLAEGDDDDQPEALDEVRRRYAPGPHAACRRTDVVDRQRGGPKRQLPRAVEEARDHQQGRTEGGGRDDPHDGAEKVAVATTGNGIQDEVEGARDEIGDAEGDTVTAEGARRCERHHEHRCDRCEHGQPDCAFLGT
jgi:hypothetical protein